MVNNRNCVNGFCPEHNKHSIIRLAMVLLI
jgi:hypothetical protein